MRRFIRSSISVASIVFTILMLQGCMVAAIGAGIGAVKWGNAKKVEAQAKCNESYNTYLNIMLKSNKNPLSKRDYCDGSVSS